MSDETEVDLMVSGVCGVCGQEFCNHGGKCYACEHRAAAVVRVGEEPR